MASNLVRVGMVAGVAALGIGFSFLVFSYMWKASLKKEEEPNKETADIGQVSPAGDH